MSDLEKWISELKAIRFSWASPCKHCPTMQGSDPEADDYMSWPFKERIQMRFRCAWREEGFCYANAKTLYYGQTECLIGKQSKGDRDMENNKHWQLEKNYFIRTVTHHYTGQLIHISDNEIVLKDVAWISYDGRFADVLKTGNFDEVEPYPDGVEVIINRGALCDASIISFPLPRVQK